MQLLCVVRIHKCIMFVLHGLILTIYFRSLNKHLDKSNLVTMSIKLPVACDWLKVLKERLIDLVPSSEKRNCRKWGDHVGTF